MPDLIMFRALWTYRGFVWSSVAREFSARYRESLLGAIWSVANPLAMIVIYTVIFSQLMRATLPGQEQQPFAFSIYICAGIITWTLFSEMLQRMTNVFIEHGNLIKKSNFPRICLPAIVTLTALINFAIILALYLLFLAIIGHWPGWLLLALIPLVALQVLFTVGLGILLGTLNVFFRDIGQLTSVVLHFWFWLTPIVYTKTILPPSVQEMMRLNPLEPLIESYQGLFLTHEWPNFAALLPLTLITIALLLIGARFFLSRVGELVDEL
ncbi:MAG: ABC transporter permease [Sphingobacteriia bacterium]|nr:ABC transporter permease [Sphingobacteriia bacterium]NCC39444.1 ABC transporter permease [Gammaproteobacteria bacterium]